ncbi:uncharacterized protein LOC141612982 [Silene latifolia]|uniref:uncharacterized protein LOC141612982 n=1 Tax=Silene latifolia TaxID=37657 RepID=UPI003D785351
MDRSWMYGKRDFVYLERLEEFLSCAVEHQRLHGDNQFVCPCTLCQNRKKVNSRDELREHLILKGFKADYNVWIWHGESDNDICTNVNFGINDKDGDQIDVGVENDDEIFENIDMDDNIEPDNDNIDGLMKDLEEDIVECPIIFQRMVDNSKKPLYPNAYGNLSGYRLKTDKGCPVCGDETESDWLEHSGKFSYRGGRRFLLENHQYRKKKKAFYGKTEHRKRPVFLSGEEYYDKVKNITTVFGKPYVPPPDGHLYVRHCIDVMHVEKNVFDSVIGTLLNMPNKTKDGVKARNDMAARGDRVKTN